jgi:hypothetical protein
MTPEQLLTLTHKLSDIQLQLHNLTIPTPNLDTFTANQIIAQARLDLHSIDSQLFNCYQIIRPTPTPKTTPKYVPSIDDLEI